MSKRSPLYTPLLDQGARLIEYQNWSIPQHFGSPIEEHYLVRGEAGVFDCAHFGIIDIAGEGAETLLSYVLSNDIMALKVSQLFYSCILNELGHIVADVRVYHLQVGLFRIICQPIHVEAIGARLANASENLGVRITVRDDLTALLVQGPKARQQVTKIFSAFSPLLNMQPSECYIENDNILGCVSITGEDGLEWMLPQKKVTRAFEEIIAAGIRPIGFGAWETLRVEAGIKCYGQDMDDKVSPLESDLAKTVSLERATRDFVGRNAILAQMATGNHGTLLGVVLQKGGAMLQAGLSILGQDNSLGVVTSAVFSPTLKQSIGFARVSHWDNQHYSVIVHNQLFALQVVPLPFVPGSVPLLGPAQEAASA